ncbi:hypothetical protein GCM10027040_27790 [Halomonas shantousis]
MRANLLEKLKQMDSSFGSTRSDQSRSRAEQRLEEELDAERDGRQEDRFLFIIALFVLFDIWTLKDSGTWALPIVLAVIQLFALLILARRMGIEEIHLILNQLLPHFRLKNKDADDSPPVGQKKQGVTSPAAKKYEPPPEE